jgi:tetratricopeptide (TPR) repeat protein
VGDSAWAALPDRTRQSLRGTMARLEELGQGAAKRPAAGASELLGLMQYLFVGDLRGAEASLRRAISLDPNRAQAWDALTLLLATHNRAEDLVTVCEARLKHSDTARHRVLLVKACDQLNQSDRLLEEAEAAQRRYPEDDYVNLTLAAVLMKTSSELGTLNRAGQLLLKAERAATSGATRDQLAHLLYLRGLFLGLVGEKEEARKTFKQLLELDRNHADAQEALQALE